MYILLDDEAVL